MLSYFKYVPISQCHWPHIRLHIEKSYPNKKKSFFSYYVIHTEHCGEAPHCVFHPHPLTRQASDLCIGRKKGEESSLS